MLILEIAAGIVLGCFAMPIIWGLLECFFERGNKFLDWLNYGDGILPAVIRTIWGLFFLFVIVWVGSAIMGGLLGWIQALVT